MKVTVDVKNAQATEDSSSIFDSENVSGHSHSHSHSHSHRLQLIQSDSTFPIPFRQGIASELKTSTTSPDSDCAMHVFHSAILN